MFSFLFHGSAVYCSRPCLFLSWAWVCPPPGKIMICYFYLCLQVPSWSIACCTPIQLTYKYFNVFRPSASLLTSYIRGHPVIPKFGNIWSIDPTYMINLPSSSPKQHSHLDLQPLLAFSRVVFPFYTSFTLWSCPVWRWGATGRSSNEGHPRPPQNPVKISCRRAFWNSWTTIRCPNGDWTC